MKIPPPSFRPSPERRGRCCGGKCHTYPCQGPDRECLTAAGLPVEEATGHGQIGYGVRTHLPGPSDLDLFRQKGTDGILPRRSARPGIPADATQLQGPHQPMHPPTAYPYPLPLQPIFHALRPVERGFPDSAGPWPASGPCPLLNPNPPMDGVRTAEGGRGSYRGDGLGSIMAWALLGRREAGGGSSVVAQGPYGRLRTLGQGKMAGRGRSKRHSRTGLARVGEDVQLAG